MHKDQKQASKEKMWVSCLKQRLPLGMMSERETRFAEGLVKFFEDHGYLTQKQEDSARKLAVRLICEKDPFFSLKACF